MANSIRARHHDVTCVSIVGLTSGMCRKAFLGRYSVQASIFFYDFTAYISWIDFRNPSVHRRANSLSVCLSFSLFCWHVKVVVETCLNPLNLTVT